MMFDTKEEEESNVSKMSVKEQPLNCANKSASTSDEAEPIPYDPKQAEDTSSNGYAAQQLVFDNKNSKDHGVPAPPIWSLLNQQDHHQQAPTNEMINKSREHPLVQTFLYDQTLSEEKGALSKSSYQEFSCEDHENKSKTCSNKRKLQDLQEEVSTMSSLTLTKVTRQKASSTPSLPPREIWEMIEKQGDDYVSHSPFLSLPDPPAEETFDETKIGMTASSEKHHQMPLCPTKRNISPNSKNTVSAPAPAPLQFPNESSFTPRQKATSVTTMSTSAQNQISSGTYTSSLISSELCNNNAKAHLSQSTKAAFHNRPHTNDSKCSSSMMTIHHFNGGCDQDCSPEKQDTSVPTGSNGIYDAPNHKQLSHDHNEMLPSSTGENAPPHLPCSPATAQHGQNPPSNVAASQQQHEDMSVVLVPYDGASGFPHQGGISTANNRVKFARTVARTEQGRVHGPAPAPLPLGIILPRNVILPPQVVLPTFIPPMEEPVRTEDHFCIPLATKNDEELLSEFLCYVRSDCADIFTATQEDVASRRNSKKISLDQAGIRCRFCAHLPHDKRTGRSSCYPSSISRIYQSLTMMLREHFTKCSAMPDIVAERYMSLKANSATQSSTGSKKYWIHSAKSVGLVDTEGSGIRFASSFGSTPVVLPNEDDEYY